MASDEDRAESVFDLVEYGAWGSAERATWARLEAMRFDAERVAAHKTALPRRPTMPEIRKCVVMCTDLGFTLPALQIGNIPNYLVILSDNSGDAWEILTPSDLTELTPAEIAATGDAELIAWVKSDFNQLKAECEIAAQAAEIERLKATSPTDIFRDALDALEARACQVNPQPWGATAWEAINDLPDAYARVVAERDAAIELLRGSLDAGMVDLAMSHNVRKFLEGK